MKEKYMIVRIISVLAELKEDNTLVTEACYIPVDLNHDTRSSAFTTKEQYRYPKHYIIVKYWT